MPGKRMTTLSKVFLTLFAAVIVSHSDVQLDPYFSDNMVLQQGERNRVWGTHTGDRYIWVTYGEEKKYAEVRKDGTWEADILVDTTSGDRILTVAAGTRRYDPDSVTALQNVVAGDVWVMAFCAGSGVPTQHSRGAGLLPSIRVSNGLEGGWKICHSKMDGITAFSLHFADSFATPEAPMGAIRMNPGQLMTSVDLSSRSGKAERFSLDIQPLVEKAMHAEAAEYNDFEKAQAKRLIEAKHAGRVETKYIFTEFKDVQVLHPSDFTREARGALPTLKGVLYAPCD